MMQNAAEINMVLATCLSKSANSEMKVPICDIIVVSWPALMVHNAAEIKMALTACLSKNRCHHGREHQLKSTFRALKK